MGTSGAGRGRGGASGVGLVANTPRAALRLLARARRAAAGGLPAASVGRGGASIGGSTLLLRRSALAVGRLLAPLLGRRLAVRALLRAEGDGRILLAPLLTRGTRGVRLAVALVGWRL